MSQKQTAVALDALAKYADNSYALRIIALYFLTKFPQHVDNAIKMIDLIPINTPTAGPAADDSWREIEVIVPAGANQFSEWPERTYRVYLDQLRDWSRLYKSNGTTGRVDAIKTCRNALATGLKEAKDFCEYIATKEW
jgi:hypothetical protein